MLPLDAFTPDLRGQMKVSTSGSSPLTATADLLAVMVPKPPVLDGVGAQLDKALDGRLSRLIASGEVRGAVGAVTLVHTEGTSVRAKRVALAGVGSAVAAGRDEVRSAAGAVARAASAARAPRIAFACDGTRLEPAELARCIVEGTVLGGYRFDRYRTQNRDDLPPVPRSLTLLTRERSTGAAARRAELVATATNRARDLQNTPPNDMGPEQLVARARELARGNRTLRAEALDERRMAAKGMGAFLAVARGSARPARLIVMRYTPTRAPRQKDVVLGLVGKGLTFDSGGYTLKPGRAMVGMKYDMSGAAAVIEATAAIAELGLPVKVITVVGTTDNMIDTNAFMVDEVVKASNGKTIEINNTDAEGRLVLADCMHHARTLGVTHLVDIATLTGGVTSALGDYFGGIMGRDQGWVDRLLDAGERSGDHLWQLPLHETFRRYFRSDIADMANSSTYGMAVSGYAARFLQEFAGDGPWAHLDIASIADLTRPRGDEFGKGGTGFGVRLLVELAESLC